MIPRSRALIIHVIVVFIIQLLAIPTIATVAAVSLEDTNIISSEPWTRKAAFKMLAMVGISGLCHPTSDQYAPTFPHCSSSSSSSSSSYIITNHTGDSNTLEQYEKYDHQEEREQIMANLRQRYLVGDDDKGDDDLYDYWSELDDAYYNDGARDNRQQQRQQYEAKSKWFYLIHASLTLFCVTVGAVASGLYIGLLSLDPLLLVIKSRTAETEKERKRATKLLALVKRRHQLIVTLLVVNCIAAEAMPIFLQRLVHDSAAILVSVVLVLVFGEIIPSIVFTGVDQIKIASRLIPLVRLLMFILYPIVGPIAYLMEVLGSGGKPGEESRHGGHTGTVYNRGELAALIRVQYEERRALREQRKEALQEASLTSLNDLDGRGGLGELSLNSLTASTSIRGGHRRGFHKQCSLASIDSHDVNIMEGALQLKIRTAMDVFIGFHRVFCAPHDMVLDEANIFTIYASGYSRVPVFVNNDRRRIKGILMTRQLMVVNRSTSADDNDSHKSSSVSSAPEPPCLADLKLYIPQCVAPETNLADLINLFQTGGSSSRVGHMALVCARPNEGNDALDQGLALPERAGLMGIITLEDVLENLLQEQIYDENDHSDRFVRPLDGMATIEEVQSYHLAL